MNGYVHNHLCICSLPIKHPQEDSLGEIISDETDPSKEPFFDFRLPNDEFKNLMFERRLAPAGSSSPIEELMNDARDEPRGPSTVDDSEGNNDY